MIYHSAGTFQGVEGLELYYQSWTPPGKVRAILAIVHGLGAHSSLYTNIIEYLLPKQYAVYSYDMRGHGRSPGARGYINKWAEYRDDLQAFLKLIQQQHAQQPIFLLGHSMGGLVVIDYTLRYPQKASKLQGIITIAPSIGEVGVSPLKLLLGKILSRIYPRFSLDAGLDITAGSRDESILASYTQDKLRHRRGTARLSTEFFNTLAWVQSHVKEWCRPLLILHGSADRITLAASSEIFYQQINYPDKLRIEYPGAYHDLYCDINYKEVLGDLNNWLEKHLPIETTSLESVMND